MNTFNEIWSKLAKSKRYRESFVFSMFKRSVPFQIQGLRKQRGWSQEMLARNANLTQGVISRAEDQDYGNLTINTICRIAGGFDVAFIGKFVPFSELGRWFTDLSEESAKVPSFEEENEILGSVCADAVVGKLIGEQMQIGIQGRISELGSVADMARKGKPSARFGALAPAA